MRYFSIDIEHGEDHDVALAQARETQKGLDEAR